MSWVQRMAKIQALSARQNLTETDEDAGVLAFLEEMYRRRGLTPPDPNGSLLLGNGSFPSFHPQGHHAAHLEHKFAIILVILGVVAVLLNLLILVILARHRRHVVKHAFYMLISNFAFIDTLKGCCLILWATKTLVTTSEGAILIFKIEQITLITLRFSNLGTILNLLMITLNEFVFIKFPLRYHMWVTKRRICVLVVLSWIVSMAFTLSTTFARMNVRAIRIVPCPGSNSTNTTDSGILRFSSNKCMLKPENPEDSMPIHNIFTFTLIGFCAVCLVVVVTCYAIFFRIIHRIQKQDDRIAAELRYQNTLRHKSSLGSCSSSDNSSEEKRIKKQLLKRSKYVLVIGSVICIYILYLISYSTIQILQYLRVRGRFRSMSNLNRDKSSLIIRWLFQTLVGLHSIFQPLCYFRMREFREFVNKALGYPLRKRHSAANIPEFVSTSHLDTDNLFAVRNTISSYPCNSQQQRRSVQDNSERVSLMQTGDGNGCVGNGKRLLSALGKAGAGGQMHQWTRASVDGSECTGSDMVVLNNYNCCGSGKKLSVQFSSRVVFDEESKPLYV